MDVMTLTDAQRAELQAELPPGGYSGSVASRAQIVLWYDQGYSVAEIATMAATTKVTVYKWIDRYQEGGVAAMESRKSTGRPREIFGEARSRILALTRQGTTGVHRTVSLVKPGDGQVPEAA